MEMRRTLKLDFFVIVVLVFIYGKSLTLEALRREKLPHSTTSLVRICVNRTAEEAYVGCLGVYISFYGILADGKCMEMLKQAKTVHVMVDGLNMDCNSGFSRKPKEYYVKDEYLIIKLATSFSLSSTVSMLPLLTVFNYAARCYVYCNRRSVLSVANNETSNNTCGATITGKRILLLKHCTLNSDDANSRCGRFLKQTAKNTFDPLMSPVLCDESLVGFVEDYNIITDEVIFRDILSKRNDIQDMMSQ